MNKHHLLSNLLSNLLGNKLSFLENKLQKDFSEIQSCNCKIKETNLNLNFCFKSLSSINTKNLLKNDNMSQIFSHKHNYSISHDNTKSSFKSNVGLSLHKTQNNFNTNYIKKNPIIAKNDFTQRPLTPINFSKKFKKSPLSTISCRNKNKSKDFIKNKFSVTHNNNNTTLKYKKKNHLCSTNFEPKLSKSNLSIFTSSTNTLSNIINYEKQSTFNRNRMKERLTIDELDFNSSIEDISHIDDVLLTSISTDCFIRNPLCYLKKFKFNQICEDKSNFVFSDFLSNEDALKLVLVNKRVGRTYLSYFIDKINKSIETMKSEILDEVKPKFPLKSKTNKALEILNDTKYMGIFFNRKNPSEGVKNVEEEVFQVYRILIQLFNKKKKIINEIILSSQNKKLFWIKISEFFYSNSKEKFGDFLKTELLSFDYSKENIDHIQTQVKNHLSLFTTYKMSKKCFTTSLVVTFLNDVLDNLKIFKRIKTEIYDEIIKRYERLKGILHLNEII